MLIPLTQGKFAIIDDEDFELVKGYKWSASKASHTFYAITGIYKPDGTKTTIAMHRLLLDLKKGESCDHINHDGLDNRRCNIRKVSNQQNGMNRLKNKGCSCMFKGVCYYKQTKKWKAQIMIDGNPTHLGYFNTSLEGAFAYDKKAKELFGDYAYLNFPDYNFNQNL